MVLCGGCVAGFLLAAYLFFCGAWSSELNRALPWIGAAGPIVLLWFFSFFNRYQTYRTNKTRLERIQRLCEAAVPVLEKYNATHGFFPQRITDAYQNEPASQYFIIDSYFEKDPLNRVAYTAEREGASYQFRIVLPQSLGGGFYCFLSGEKQWQIREV